MISNKLIAMAAAAVMAAAGAAAMSAAASATTAVSPIEPSQGWNGYVYVVQPSAKYADEVLATWTVPRLTAASCTNTLVHYFLPPSAAVWVGLGGVANIKYTPLVQIGTETGCNWVRNSKGQQVLDEVSFPFWEVIQNSGILREDTGPTMIKGYPMGIGDSVTAAVYFTESGHYYMAIRDNTRGWTWGPHEYVTTYNEALPDTAEWIVEPTADTELADFGTVEFTDMFMEVGGTLYVPLQDSYPGLERVYGPPKVVVIYPVLLTGSSPNWDAIGKIVYVP